MPTDLDKIYGAIASIVKEKMPDTDSAPDSVELEINAEFSLDGKDYQTVFSFDKEKGEFVSDGDIKLLATDEPKTDTETPKEETKEVEAETEKADDAMDSSTESDTPDVEAEKADTEEGQSLAELSKTVKDLQAQIEELKSCMPVTAKSESEVLNDAEELVEAEKGNDSTTPSDLPESKKANLENSWLNDTFETTF
jgi:hypothetical protein